jgi:predicted  nucleic acid-binding Zn-ribbon protein
MRHLVPVVALLSVFLLAGTGLLARARGQDQTAPKPAWEWKAVSLGADEKEATKKLNQLAAGGWEYVGPLTNGLVAFKRPTDASQADLKTAAVRGNLRRAFYRSGNVEQQRNAILEQVLRTQAALGELDGRLDKQRAGVLAEALNADEEVRNLRGQIRQARDTLDEYRSKGLDLGRPTPAAARQTIADVQPRLEQRVRQIETALRARAEDPEPLRRVRLHLLDEIGELRELLDGLNADVEKNKTGKATAAPESKKETSGAAPR